MFRRGAPEHEFCVIPLGKRAQERLSAAAKKGGAGAPAKQDGGKLSLKMLQKKEADDTAAAAVWEVRGRESREEGGRARREREGREGGGGGEASDKYNNAPAQPESKGSRPRHTTKARA